MLTAELDRENLERFVREQRAMGATLRPPEPCDRAGGRRAADRLDLACRWAQEWVDRLQGRGRYRALLRIQRTLAECLAVAGHTAAAKQLLCSILISCADAGMVRFPIDGGDRLVSLITEVRDEGASSSLVPFLDETLAAAGRPVATMPGPADGRTV